MQASQITVICTLQYLHVEDKTQQIKIMVWDVVNNQLLVPVYFKS